MELKYYFDLVRRWAWALILGLTLGALGGYFYSSSQTPVYATSTKVMITRAPQERTVDYYSYVSTQQLVSTYMELLKTSSLLEIAKERLGYSVSAGQISSSTVEGTQIFQIRIQDDDPVHAMEIANTLVEVLIEQNEILQTGRFASTEKTLQAQIDQVQKQVDALQTDINNISQKSIEEQITQVEEQIVPLQAEVTNLQQELALLNVPRLTDEQTRRKIEIQNRIAQIQPVLTLYQQVYGNLLVLGQSSVSGTQDSARLSQLRTTLNLYQQIYLNLLTSLENVRLSRLQNTPTVSQIEPARLPGSPISPTPLTDTLFAAAIGLALAGGIVFLIEYLDDTIKTPEDVENLLGLTVLGYISEVAMNKNSAKGLYVSNQPRSPVAEAFRSLRTNLEFSSVDHPVRTLLVTSAEPSEGKTTIAGNLAGIIAQSGKHVALVDADLRRPSAHRLFDVHNRSGLTDVFRNKLSLDTVSHSWNGNGEITLVTTGSLPPNPTEMLGSEKMMQIIEELKRDRDLVIIDSPPSIVADAQVLAAKVDGVVIVVRPGRTHLDGLRATLEQLNRAGANVLGIIFNRIPHDRGSYYGGYKHYSQYYYRKYQYHYPTDEGADANITEEKK
jgi:capsular exopolysaccharide synthesis family protein